MTIAITGATGHLGRLIIEGLLRNGTPATDIVALGRSAEKLATLNALGVATCIADYTDRASLDAALAGVDTVMLVSGSEVGQRFAQHSAVIDAAKAAGVSRLVYTSAPAATTSALILAPEHKATEEYLVASGVPYTILRNGWYTENYTGTAQQAIASGTLATSAGEGTVSSASRKDYADAAAVVLVDDGHLGQTYELSGDTAWTFGELADTVSALSGKPVALVPLTPEEHHAALVGAGLDDGTAGFVVALDGNIRDGLLGHTPGDLARLIGRPTTPLREGLAETL